MSGAPTISMAELTALGMTVRDGKAVRVGSGAEGQESRLETSAPVTSPTASPYRSKTEAKYALLLAAMQRVGDIRDWRYEAVTLRLGDRVRFTPDFRVVLVDGVVELHEVKGGYIRDDARIKLQTAATLFPEYRFKLAEYGRGGCWSMSTVRAA